jgi:hypothetical protein
MSVFDLAKNNRDNNDVTVTMSYARFDEYLRMAQTEALEAQYSDGIATAVRVGRDAERNRIIALLEDNLFTDKGLGNVRVSDLINLIKGETND